MKNLRTTEAVSEILSEIILLAIAVTSISVIYTQVLSTPGPTDIANVSIVGKMEEGRPVFELQRGESLGLDTKFFITLAGFDQREFLQRDLVNQEWNIGERVILPVEDIKGIQVEAAIVDKNTNSIVFWGILQQGFTTYGKGGIWHFDEPFWNGTYDEVKDSSGNNNHGIAINSSKIIDGTINPQDVIINNSGFFDGFRDVVKVNSSWTLDITNSITIEAWMKPQLRKTVADLVETQGEFGYTPYVIHVIGNIYAMVSEDLGKVGRLSTVTISDLGEIDPIQNVSFGGSTSKKCLRPMITQISEQLFLISYNGNDGYIHLKTFYIFNNGSIQYTGYEKKCTDYKVANDPGNPNRPSQLRITENVCAVAYWGNGPIGILKTLNISSNGNIEYIDNVTYSNTWFEPCLVHVTGDVYALAFRNTSNYGIIKTFRISPLGDIQSIDEKGYSGTGFAYEPCLIKVTQNVFAVTYRDENSYGYVTIVNITSNGIIEPANETEIFENRAGECYNPYIIRTVDFKYVIVYSSADTSGENRGYLVTLSLYNNGVIGPIDPRKEFEVPEGNPLKTRCFDPIILRISDYLFAISYEGFGSHPGKLITCLIGKIPRGICKGFSYMLFANTTAVEGCINDVYVSYSDNSFNNTWHHFALTYDGMSICLYMNGIKVDETSYQYRRIKLTKEDLYFGRYYSGFIDEIAIYDRALTQEQIVNHFMNPGIFEKYYT